MTDHKPLLGLLKEHRPTSQQASSRIKHWSLFLSNYEYRLMFRNTSAHANADALVGQTLPQLSTSTVLTPIAPLHPWKWPTRPWARLHLDFAGPFQGKNILIAVDAHSKWIEAVCTPSMSSSCVIEELRSLFAKFGLPEMVVTDNGTCFVSSEFKHSSRLMEPSIVLQPLIIQHQMVWQRAVQTIKLGLKKVRDGTMNSRLAKVLFTYRVTPQSTTGLAPAELLLGRRPRTRLDLLKPHTAERANNNFRKNDMMHVENFKPFILVTVLLRNFTGSGWLPGRVVGTTGPVSFHVLLEDGRSKRCHQDQYVIELLMMDLQKCRKYH